MKRFICVLMSAVLMLLNGVTENIVSFASEGTGDYSYTVVHGDGGAADSITITRYNGADAEVTVPAVLDGKPVTAIGSGAFAYQDGIESVAIPEGVNRLGRCFRFAEHLKSVSLPDTVTELPQSLFEGCTALEHIAFGDNITLIEANALKDSGYYKNAANWEDGALYLNHCLIEAKKDVKGALNIKDGTRLVAEQAFKGCAGITSITLPASLKELYTQEYDYCSSLKAIYAAANHPLLVSKNGVLFTKDMETVVKYPRARAAKNYMVPTGVKTVGEGAYKYASLNEVVLPSEVETVGVYAFAYSSVKKVTIGSSVRTVREYAFINCPKLKSVYVPKTVTAIAYGAFGCREYSAYSDEVLYKRQPDARYADSEYRAVGQPKFTLYGDKGSAAEQYSISAYNTSDEDGSYSFLIHFVPVDFPTPKVTIKGGKKTIRIHYKKVKGAAGFQVSYQKGKTTRIKTFRSKKSARKAIKQLKKGNYKVRVRAYYQTKGHSFYSRWSKKKTVRVKG